MRLPGYTRVNTTGHDAQWRFDASVRARVQKQDVFCDMTPESKTAVERPGVNHLLTYAADSIALTALAQKSGVALRAFQRWYHLYKAGGVIEAGRPFPRHPQLTPPNNHRRPTPTHQIPMCCPKALALTTGRFYRNA